jgi:hypothetical protein
MCVLLLITCDFVDDLQLTCFQHVCFIFSAIFRLNVIEPLPAVCESLFLCSNNHVLILGLPFIFSLYVISFDIKVLLSIKCVFFHFSKYVLSSVSVMLKL